MPVYNALPYLDEAIESILGQTFSNFEFVILNDGSTDGSAERLRQWASQDPRIRLLEAKRNLGPARSSERAARAASAPIVARMDADDISCRERLREQLDLLRECQDVGIVASLCEVIDTSGRVIRGPESWRLARDSLMVPFPHGAMMYRQAVFERVGGYREECEFWEDQDLITRMAAVSKVLVIPRSLYQVRQSGTSTRSASDQARQEAALDHMYKSLARAQPDARGNKRPDGDSGAGAKVDPRVFIALGSVTLWAGGKPRLLGRLLRRGKIGIDFRSLSAMVWTAWASISPGTLRQFLLLLLAARNAVSARKFDPSNPVLWPQPRKPAMLTDRAERDS